MCVCVFCVCVFSSACRLFVADNGELGTLIVRQSEVYLWKVNEGGVAQWWKVSISTGSVRPSLREVGVQVCFYGHLVRVLSLLL